ncbi:MAG: penicillin-binding transpeptidase domain-containing protein [Desulfobacterales bacterium]|nr:penicillin-binding transpeptidase domain-containing protein [Desulfobacterales bacterium]
MAGYDKANPAGNPCLDSRFPAASIFKIITAAAAVETRDLDPGSMLKFSGGKYTLYKSQIDPKTPKNANQITLKDSFAQSVNPVFGKLGANLLGKEVIEAYAEAFGFNREIDFELPLAPEPDRADRRRVRAGRSRQRLQPHARGSRRCTERLMAAAVVNQGRWVEPTIVDWVLQRCRARRFTRARRSSGIECHRPGDRRGRCRQLMQATVQSGTAHKEFQKHHGDTDPVAAGDRRQDGLHGGWRRGDALRLVCRVCP